MIPPNSAFPTALTLSFIIFLASSLPQLCWCINFILRQGFSVFCSLSFSTHVTQPLQLCSRLSIKMRQMDLPTGLPEVEFSPPQTLLQALQVWGSYWLEVFQIKHEGWLSSYDGGFFRALTLELKCNVRLVKSCMTISCPNLKTWIQLLEIKIPKLEKKNFFWPKASKGFVSFCFILLCFSGQAHELCTMLYFLKDALHLPLDKREFGL